MATYAELAALPGNPGYTALLDRVRVACIIAAADVFAEDGATPNHANRLTWAIGVFDNPRREAERMLQVAIAENSSAAISAILAAADTVLQANVDNFVDLFATGA